MPISTFDVCCHCHSCLVHFASLIPLVPEAGELFEWFILQFCVANAVARFRRAALDHDRNVQQIPDEEYDYFRDTYAMKFAGFVFTSLLHSGNKGNKQAFFTNFALRYHGLSRFGTAIQSKLGIGLPLSPMDAWLVRVRAERQQELR